MPLQSSYRYIPPNEDPKEIRLLTLHKGNFNADLRITIHTVPLAPKDSPSYEALSCVHVLLENSINIQVGLRQLPIARNLAEALPYLRYKETPRVLWIDAICVNQQDLKERSLQVKRMADIYRLADRVVVWLGLEKNDSGGGIRILKHLSSQIQVDWDANIINPASRESQPHWSDQAKILPYDDEKLLAINELLGRRWFERLWVQQEIRLANRHAIFMCGSDVIAWRSLPRAIFCLNHKKWSPKRLSPSLRSLRDRVRFIFHLAHHHSPMSFLEIMRQTTHCKCFDPRDRVYAILSLLDISEKPNGIEPDYGKTTCQVYQDVALHYIAHHKKVNLLRLSGLKDELSEMPTWVPDWTVSKVANLLTPRLASGFSYSRVQYRDSGVLSVTGTHSATLQYSKKMSSCFDKSLITRIHRATPDDTLRVSYISGGSLLVAYCHTVCASDFADAYLPIRKGLPRVQQSLDFLSAILQPTKQRVPGYGLGTEAHKFLNAASHYLKDKLIITTREGYIGLAPPKALPGDHVCVLLGCATPLLLRPVPNHQFRVVGECYVHGLMDGEAFLGPLPDQKRDSYKWGFLDHQSGKIQSNDPRFGSPPNDEGDPRLTPEMIEKRGVKLQTFDLI